MGHLRRRHLLIASVAVAALIASAVNSLAVSFLPPSSIVLGNSTNFAHAVKTADLNHDGRRDIVVVDWVSNVVDVILALPGGGFGPVTRIPSAPAPYSVELRDLNGDTHLDVITGNFEGRSVSVFLGNGSGGFLARTDYPTPGQVSVATVGDVNGDGHLDVVVAAELRICVLAGNGTGQLAAPVSTILGTTLAESQTWGVALGDLDQDGDLDVVTNFIGPLVELLNSGDGTFTRHDYGSSVGSRALAIADVTGDGLADVIAASHFQDGIIVFTGNGAGGLVQRPVIPTGVSPWSLGVADLDGDGDIDVVTPNIGSNTISILLGAAGGLGSPTTLPTSLNPISVDVADVDGDGRRDVVETGYSGTVSIRIQIAGGGAGPSSVTLSALPSPATYGEDVTLTATVSPSTATGGVQFVDGVNLLGVAAVEPGGVAHLVVNALTGGFHSLRADYLGDSQLSPSESAPALLEINAAPTTTTLTTSPNPSAIGGTVLITASVQATPPSAIDGFVIFRLDGALWRNVPVNPLSGTAATTISSLSLGHHSLVASYEGTANHLLSLSSTVDQVVVDITPVIVSVRDVPRDQGGRVTVKWDSPADAPGSTAVSGYRIWRRAPADGAALFRAGRVSRRFVLIRPPGGAQADYWEALADLPAERLVHYAYTASTTQDSMRGDNPYTAFMVTALGPDGAFHQSNVDSGYSVDNLGPGHPRSFVVHASDAGTSLHWDVSDADDFAFFQLYRGDASDFVPAADNHVATLPDTGYLDPEGTAGNYYKLSTVDRHGNESAFVTAAPSGGPTSVPSSGEFARLRGIAPNPSRTGAFQISFTLTSHARVTLELFDITGRKLESLEVGRLGPGQHAVDLTRDRALPVGVYQVCLDQGGRRFTAKAVVLR